MLVGHFVYIQIIRATIGIRMSEYEELMGADFCEHDIVDSLNMDRESNSGSGSTRRRSSFGFIRHDGSARGSLRTENSLRKECYSEEDGGTEVHPTSPTHIVISTISEEARPEKTANKNGTILRDTQFCIAMFPL